MEDTVMKIRSLALLVIGALFLVVPVFSARSAAGINAPPPYTFHAPPPVVVIPGTGYVYMVPDANVDVLFYHGDWWRPYNDHWYRSQYYNGPWQYMAPPGIPHALMVLPPGYRHMPPGHQRIPPGQVKKYWKTWEQERYWDSHKEWHGEGDKEHGEGGKGHGHGKGKD
jgi:hypothetical protein